MGDPRRLRKKYATPLHMWQKERVESEKKLAEEYGLKNKKEIWKSGSTLRNLAKQAKRLIALKDSQAEKERKQLLARLELLGLVEKGADLTAVLNLTIRDMLERRLQTVVYRRNLARTIQQARQFVVHRHISVGKSRMTVPSYMVKKREEDMIVFTPYSALSSAEHPERAAKDVKGGKTEAGEEK